MPPHRLQQVERADGIGLEIIERYSRRAIVRWLGSGVHYGMRPEFTEQIEKPLTVTDVDFMMSERVPEFPDEPVLIPAGVPFGTEEHGTLIIVDAMNVPSRGGKIGGDFRPDEPG